MTAIGTKRAEQIISGFTGKRILVAGDLMIDEYLWGNVARLSPEAPVPVIDIEEESVRFGGAANVALNLKKLGCEPILFGLVGTDRMADLFFDLMKVNGLSTDGIVKTSSRPTTVKTRIIGDNQHIARVDREHSDYVKNGLHKKMLDLAPQLISTVDAVILEDYNKGFLTDKLIQRILVTSNQQGIISTVDPKFVNFLEYKNATLFKPNIKETAQALARMIKTDQDIQEAGNELRRLLQAENVLLTLGAAGMALFESDGTVTRIPTKTRKVADVSGAGDTVISTLTAAMTGGATMQEAAYMANYAAGIVIEEVGVVPIEVDRLKLVLTDQDD